MLTASLGPLGPGTTGFISVPPPTPLQECVFGAPRSTGSTPRPTQEAPTWQELPKSYPRATQEAKSTLRGPKSTPRCPKKDPRATQEVHRVALAPMWVFLLHSPSDLPLRAQYIPEIRNLGPFRAQYTLEIRHLEPSITSRFATEGPVYPRNRHLGPLGAPYTFQIRHSRRSISSRFATEGPVYPRDSPLRPSRNSRFAISSDSYGSVYPPHR